MTLTAARTGRSRPLARATGSAAWLLAAMLTSTCGGGSSPSSPSTGGGGGGNTLVFTVTSSGVSPRTMTVPNGSRVVFVNNDSRPHDMTSNPHPTHEDCPELNQVGFLNPGQQRESGNLVQRGTCGFHDHDNPGTLTLQGSVTIQ